MHFRQAGFSHRARAVFLACLPLAIAVSAAPPAPPAAPARPSLSAGKKQPRLAPAAPAAVPPAKASTPAADPASGVPQYADAWPSEWRPTPPDLQLRAADAHKADALASFALGLLAEDNSDQDAMLERYRHALDADPGYGELAVKVAYELARRNDVPGGIQILKDAIKAAPKDPLPYIYLSQLYARYLKKPELALNYAEQALNLAPDNFKSYLALYELHDTAGQKKKAEAVLERALKNPAPEARYWSELGEFLEKIYLKEDGTCGPDELARMNAVYTRLERLAQGDRGLLAKIADFYVLSKQVARAIPIYQAVLTAGAGAEDPPLANVREKLARSYMATEQREKAIAVLEEMVRETPLRFDTYELLGELYEQQGDLDAAMKNYEHSLLLDSSEPRNHLRLADVLRQAKKYDKAVEMLQQARKKFPDLPFITYGLALALSQARRHEEALAAFAQAKAEAEKRNEELLNAGFYFTYGAAAEQAGQLEKAAELLKQSIELDPSAAQGYNYLGYMWADRGEHLDEAGTMIKKAVELEPENGAYLDSLGWYYFKKGEPEKALKELLRAQENILREDKKDDAVVLEHIADAYLKLGKTPDALSYWQKALGLETDDEKLTARIRDKIEAARQKVSSGAPTPPLLKK